MGQAHEGQDGSCCWRCATISPASLTSTRGHRLQSRPRSGRSIWDLCQLRPRSDAPRSLGLPCGESTLERGTFLLERSHELSGQDSGHERAQRTARCNPPDSTIWFGPRGQSGSHQNLCDPIKTSAISTGTFARARLVKASNGNSMVSVSSNNVFRFS